MIETKELIYDTTNTINTNLVINRFDQIILPIALIPCGLLLTLIFVKIIEDKI